MSNPNQPKAEKDAAKSDKGKAQPGKDDNKQGNQSGNNGAGEAMDQGNADSKAKEGGKKDAKEGGKKDAKEGSKKDAKEGKPNESDAEDAEESGDEEPDNIDRLRASIEGGSYDIPSCSVCSHPIEHYEEELVKHLDNLRGDGYDFSRNKLVPHIFGVHVGCTDELVQKLRKETALAKNKGKIASSVRYTCIVCEIREEPSPDFRGDPADFLCRECFRERKQPRGGHRQGSNAQPRGQHVTVHAQPKGKHGQGRGGDQSSSFGGANHRVDARVKYDKYSPQERTYDSEDERPQWGARGRSPERGGARVREASLERGGARVREASLERIRDLEGEVKKANERMQKELEKLKKVVALEPDESARWQPVQAKTDVPLIHNPLAYERSPLDNITPYLHAPPPQPPVSFQPTTSQYPTNEQLAGLSRGGSVPEDRRNVGVDGQSFGDRGWMERGTVEERGSEREKQGTFPSSAALYSAIGSASAKRNQNV
jgi:hypothetical protein